MTFKVLYDTVDDIPETIDDFRSLFVESKDGKMELKVDGVKTTADFARMQGGVEAERVKLRDAKAINAKWLKMGELEEVQSKLDRMPELELMAEANSADDAEKQSKLDKRVEAAVRAQTLPKERELATAVASLEEANTELTGFRRQAIQRTVHDSVAEAITAEKLLTEFHDDVYRWADQVFEVVEGDVVTKDGLDILPGMSPAVWLQEIQPKRTGWWPASQGGGARGSVSTVATGNNPWSKKNWSGMAQAVMLKAKGKEYCERQAASVGSAVGAIHPPS